MSDLPNSYSRTQEGIVKMHIVSNNFLQVVIPTSCTPMYFLYLLNLFFSISILLFRPSGKVVFTSCCLHSLKIILFHHLNVSYVQK